MVSCSGDVRWPSGSSDGSGGRCGDDGGSRGRCGGCGGCGGCGTSISCGSISGSCCGDHGSCGGGGCPGGSLTGVFADAVLLFVASLTDTAGFGSVDDHIVGDRAKTAALSLAAASCVSDGVSVGGTLVGADSVVEEGLSAVNAAHGGSDTDNDVRDDERGNAEHRVDSHVKVGAHIDGKVEGTVLHELNAGETVEVVWRVVHVFVEIVEFGSVEVFLSDGTSVGTEGGLSGVEHEIVELG